MKILIGEVLKPQGIKGELKISNLTDGIQAVENVKTVFIDDESFKVLKISQRDNCLYLCLRGIFDRDTAETYRGKQVFCMKSEIEKDEDSFFIEDVIGCEVRLSTGKVIGKVVNVVSSNVDIFELTTPEGGAAFPFLKKLEPVVDVENKVITVDAKTFTEVVLYKDKL